ncbi:MAG: L-arabinose isomerase [Clostridiales bacterium]|nr:L-arabinose isomerase [Clostridiales bacterium]
MKSLYFITGSQDLYGGETLRQVANDSKEIVRFLNEKLSAIAEIVWKPTVIDSGSCAAVMREASADADCAGVITWMHTFSPAKMWIKGLQILNKPLCHLHTQANERLPYDSIDMDFMNLNQSAHGDREYGFICTRLGVRRQIVAGYYRDVRVLAALMQFAEVAKAIDFSRHLKVAMFGSNMRQVAVTDGDRVESQIRYGWEVNYYGIGDLAALSQSVTDAQIEEKLKEYRAAYTFRTDDIDAVKEQARYEIALDAFVKQHGVGAYTDNFEDLHGLRQLPGLATQRMQGKGVGFGAEGDYKTSALNAVLWKMAENREGATGFMEDYTYDMADGYVLGAHMLEVSPAFAATKPAIEVHPLGIGGKADPARLTFGGVTGSGVAVCMIDLGTHFRLVCANIELIAQPKPMPRLPVAQIMWTLKPNFEEGVRQWIEAGGGHHTVVSTALTADDIRLFAKLTGTEIVVIG